MTKALIDLLADPHQSVRQAAISALVDRKEQGVTDALLTYPDPEVRQSAAEALSGPEVTQAPLDQTRDKPGPDHVDLPLAIRLAERLMTRGLPPDGSVRATIASGRYSMAH